MKNAKELNWTKNFGRSKVVNVKGFKTMEQKPSNFEISRACWGIHVGLTMLLAICLAAYDGFQHSLPFFVGYMMFGWLIPLVLWPKIKKLLSHPVSPNRDAINRLGPPITAMILGPIFFLLGVFVPQPDKMTVNGEVISQSDPRFPHDWLMFRIFFVGIGLAATAIGYFWFCKSRKK